MFCPAPLQSLSSPCAISDMILCAVSVQSLSSPCPAPVQPLSSPCPVPVQSLCSPCAVPVQSLFTLCMFLHSAYFQCEVVCSTAQPMRAQSVPGFRQSPEHTLYTRLEGYGQYTRLEGTRERKVRWKGSIGGSIEGSMEGPMEGSMKGLMERQNTFRHAHGHICLRTRAPARMLSYLCIRTCAHVHTHMPTGPLMTISTTAAMSY